MTQHDPNKQLLSTTAKSDAQTVTRSIPAFRGAALVTLEDFSRTIRSYCSRVISPPIELPDQARRKRLTGETGFAAGTSNEIQIGNEIMTSAKNTETTSSTQVIFHGGKKMSEATIFKSLASNRLAVSIIALGTAFGAVTPAFADISNTVTVTGTAPDSSSVTDTATETVDPVDAAPVLTVTKVASDDTDVAAGETITYTYTVTNDGNVGVTNVSLSDDHNVDADGSLGTITIGALTDNGVLADSTDDAADNDYDYLAPGDMVTWTATYTVTITDIADQSDDNDGNLDNTVTASAGYTDSTGSPDTVTGTASEEVDLEDVNASLLVTKLADDTTDVTLGQLITYTYTITNNGNVPITGISLADAHGGSGTAPAPDADGATLTDNGTLADSPNGTTGDSEWDTLAPGDVLTVTATYTVTQSDIDNLQ